jgi:regulator of sigma D
MSVHPLMTDEEIHFMLDAIEQVALNYNDWKKDYVYESDTNEYHHHSYKDKIGKQVNDWFELKLN